MPPKPKSTREEIAAAAFGIIKKDGLSALTARNLGKQLNASAGSIFTVFPSMEDVKLAARELAGKLCLRGTDPQGGQAVSYRLWEAAGER